MKHEPIDDITLLRQELKPVRAVADVAPAMLAYWDASQRCVFANRAYEKRFGIKVAQIKTLRGLLPVCAWCRRIRDPKGYWDELEKFVAANTHAIVIHSICEACEKRLLEKDGLASR